MKILIIDDNSVMRNLIKNNLSSLDTELLEAADCKTGLRIAERYGKEIKLILLDWNMPEMSGFDFLQKMKTTPNFPDIPVIMVTSNGHKDDVVKAVKAGAKGYLIKPITSKSLLAKVTQFIPSTLV